LLVTWVRSDQECRRDNVLLVNERKKHLRQMKPFLETATAALEGENQSRVPSVLIGGSSFTFDVTINSVITRSWHLEVHL